MTQPLPRIDLVALQQQTFRRDWLKHLHQQGNRQCIGLYRDVDVSLTGGYATISVVSPARVCAMALLGEITEGPIWFTNRQPGVNLYTIGAKAGLSQQQVDTIVERNDGRCRSTGRTSRRHTFSEIAGLVEEWFPK